MVDFAKIKAEMAAKALKLKAEAPAVPTIVKPRKNWLERIDNLLLEHRGVLTEWETNFLYSTKAFIVGTDLYVNNDLDRLSDVLTDKVRWKIKEIESQCGVTQDD